MLEFYKTDIERSGVLGIMEVHNINIDLKKPLKGIVTFLS